MNTLDYHYINILPKLSYKCGLHNRHYTSKSPGLLSFQISGVEVQGFQQESKYRGLRARTLYVNKNGIEN